MQRGTVRWFSKAHGFGFIAPDSGEPDVFVHHSAIVGPLSEGFRVVSEGALVEFERAPKPRSNEATEVRRASAGPPAGGR